MQNVLVTDRLMKRFSGKIAVNQVNMTIKQGEIYGLIGQNGAGKTTLMRMIVGLAKPTMGSIELFGSKDLDNQRKRIGSLIENPAVYGDLTVLSNLEVYQKLLGLSNQVNLTEIVDKVGLSEAKNRKAKQLSLGMKQRLGIAIAMMGNPELLILDEPINGLDPAGIKEVRDLILELNQKNGVTILISSHILGELHKIATCYGVLKNGFLVDQFTADDLSTRCREYINVAVDDVQKAKMILSEHINEDEIQMIEPNRVQIYNHTNEIARVNRILVEQGVEVSYLGTDGQDLESYFMRMMGGEQNV